VVGARVGWSGGGVPEEGGSRAAQRGRRVRLSVPGEAAATSGCATEPQSLQCVCPCYTLWMSQRSQFSESAKNAQFLENFAQKRQVQDFKTFKHFKTFEVFKTLSILRHLSFLRLLTLCTAVLFKTFELFKTFGL